MRTSGVIWYGLLLVLLSPAGGARAAETRMTGRTLMVSTHPSREAEPIYVAGQVVTALRFENEVDPARTGLLFWEGRFEPLLVAKKKVVLEPIRDLERDEVVPLRVTLMDGTEFSFLVRRPLGDDWGFLDRQVNVFQDADSFSAVLSRLQDSLKRERKLSEENDRFKNEENSVDHALATLLANGEVQKTPFQRKQVYRSKNEDVDVVIEVFDGPGKAAALVSLKNTYYGKAWRLDGAYLTHDSTSGTSRPFALRMDRAEIVPGQSGRIAVVADESSFHSKEGEWEDLALQLFRDDGLLQVMVRMDHTLIRK